MLKLQGGAAPETDAPAPIAPDAAASAIEAWTAAAHDALREGLDRMRLTHTPEALEELADRRLFLVMLPPRFAAYLEERAQAHGVPPERMLETMVRGFWQRDEWRTARTATAPTQMGEPAGTARKR